LSSVVVLQFVVFALCTCFTTDEGIAAVNRGNSEPSARLYVANLLYTTSESALIKAFDGCVKAIIAFDKTGKSRG